MRDNALGLPLDTLIEVVRIKDNEVVKKQMKYGEWLVYNRLPDYVYRAYQIGFSSF
jgi:hypothetical protein